MPTGITTWYVFSHTYSPQDIKFLKSGLWRSSGFSVAGLVTSVSRKHIGSSTVASAWSSETYSGMSDPRETAMHLNAIVAGSKSAVTAYNIGSWSIGKCFAYIGSSMVATWNIASRPMPSIIKVRGEQIAI